MDTAIAEAPNPIATIAESKPQRKGRAKKWRLTRVIAKVSSESAILYVFLREHFGLHTFKWPGDKAIGKLLKRDHRTIGKQLLELKQAELLFSTHGKSVAYGQEVKLLWPASTASDIRAIQHARNIMTWQSSKATDPKPKPQDAPPDMSPPLPANRKQPMTEQERSLICKSAAHMGMYLRRGIGYIRDPDGNHPLLIKDWSTEPEEQWDVKTFSAYWWFLVCHCNQRNSWPIRMYDKRIFKHVKDLLDAMGPKSLRGRMLLAYTHFGPLAALMRDPTFRLTEHTLSNALVVQKLDYLSSLDEAAIAKLYQTNEG